MLFNSYIFIFIFLPICLVGFYLLQSKQATLAKVWLTCFSLWFYGYFNPWYLGLMMGSISGNYLFHQGMIKQRQKENIKIEKILLVLGVMLNLLLLFYFKYYDFFIANINEVLGTDIPMKGILLPLGISFFTFQQISFLADTYRGEMDNCGFVDYTLFVSFFPQLIAGPIVTHEEMLPQFQRIGKDEREKEERNYLFLRGIYVFVLGMSKKILLADIFGKAVDYAYGNIATLNGLESFLVILFYSLQLYFDFSGYCDMAKGLAEMFGLEIANNFNSPYQAINIIDFWKRWHITLSRFLTKNVYIPLGGNRKGKVKTYRNLFFVFLLSGIWHGAGWNFILWGVLHGGLYVITKVFLDLNAERKKEKEHTYRREIALLESFVGKVITFSYVSVAWVYFRATTVDQANQLLQNLWKNPWRMPTETFLNFFNLGEFWYPMKVLRLANLPYAKSYLMIGFILISLGIICFGKNVEQLKKKFTPSVGNACYTALLLLWCIVSLSGVSTFLYFNF